MSVQLSEESERIVQEAIRRGDFNSVDEIIAEGVKHPAHIESKPKSVYELLTQPPFAGSGLEIERQKDSPRPIDVS